MARKLARHKPERKLVGNLQRKDGKARLFDEKRHNQLDDECVVQIRRDEENLLKPGGINGGT